jgi:XTP/dITP diphosphohydrolase
MTSFVFATSNQDKVRELQLILEGFDIQPRPADLEETIEDGETLEENALKKALHVVEATGLPAIADDTGFFVAALGGAPGVRSARYAGANATYDDNVAKMLGALAHVAPGERSAEFRTCACAVFPDGTELLAEGVARGTVTTEPRVAKGFGYDPIFEPAERPGRTFAELELADKNAISHRGRAFRALRDMLLAG